VNWTSARNIYVILLVLFLLYDLRLFLLLQHESISANKKGNLNAVVQLESDLQSLTWNLRRNDMKQVIEPNEKGEDIRLGAEKQVEKHTRVTAMDQVLNLKNEQISRLTVAKLDDKSVSEATPVVHIFHTRFMQLQPDLLDLGEARLRLFETFCLPSMVHQTTNSFIWIIRTDPQLHIDLRKRMINLIKPYGNILLVANNANPFGNFRNWNATSADEFQPENVWSGSLTLLMQYHALAQTHVLIETRLDADDGLNVDFAKSVQDEAIRLAITEESSKLSANEFYKGITEYSQDKARNALPEADPKPPRKGSLVPPNSLMFFCTSEHYEWHYDGSDASGRLLSRLEDYCITPGLTIARSPTFHRVFKHIDHTLIATAVEECRSPTETNCIFWNRNLIPGAIRARTPTSAGMKYVGIDLTNETMKEEQLGHVIKIEESAREKWSLLEDRVAIQRKDATIIKDYLLTHMREIALDNIRGQCTLDHSCKDIAMQRLLRLSESSASNSSIEAISLVDEEFHLFIGF